LENDPILLFGQQIKILVIIVAGFQLCGSTLFWACFIIAFLLEAGSDFLKLLLGLQQEPSGLDGRGSRDAILLGWICLVKAQGCPKCWMSRACW
jgi:hypothetical protein